VLATAHDMSREWRFLTALSPTGVTVAEPVAHCTDTAVIGAGFYLMSWVDGVVPGDRSAGDPIPETGREACGLDTADVLAALHAVDPGTVGLGDLHRPGRYLERQLRRWHRQAHSGAFTDLAAIDTAHERLLARMPAEPAEGPRIAHGDYRPGNLSYRDGRVAAVFDWELATLGEPLADLGWLVASWERPGDARHAITSGPTAAPGWPERDAAARSTTWRTGRRSPTGGAPASAPACGPATRRATWVPARSRARCWNGAGAGCSPTPRPRWPNWGDDRAGGMTGPAGSQPSSGSSTKVTRSAR
jgi:aminoglycoside phosphotransferase (APT) family kinase protein